MPKLGSNRDIIAQTYARLPVNNAKSTAAARISAHKDLQTMATSGEKRLSATGRTSFTPASRLRSVGSSYADSRGNDRGEAGRNMHLSVKVKFKVQPTSSEKQKAARMALHGTPQKAKEALKPTRKEALRTMERQSSSHVKSTDDIARGHFHQQERNHKLLSLSL
jgi:hypothetical protein